MRRTAALLTALLLTVLAAAPAGAADDPPHAHLRLDRVAAALAEDPLFVDPDLAHALDGPERDRLRRAMADASRRLGAPVHVVVIPNPPDSESQGRDDAFLFALHERSRRDGLYLLVDARATLEAEAFRIPRRYRFRLSDEEPGSFLPSDRERPFDGLVDRLVQRMNGYAAAPTASPTMPAQYSTPDPFGKENELTPAEPETAGPFLTGFFFAGPFGVVLLYCAGRAALALLRRTGEPKKSRRPGKTRPGLPWLRREAAEELDRLRRLLATADAGRGHPYAVSAFDAAQILYDDAKEDEERAIDLVGAIVLARQGQTALKRNVAAPPVPCVVNPLHGDSVKRRRLAKLTHKVLPKPCPVCETCDAFDRQAGLTDQHLLKIPGPGRRRPHTAVPGVWRDTAWGANGKDFLPRVMRYLGVD
ncbi:hypothetical protein E1200_03980 [Actinomadura sp. GC306]|uniref:TPM domain-containing protein n=1 Tax=Actinomadura sp. GC306 TaxID=2530367 RepID=UPI00104AFB75|nr:TPM domain-containing protein [Actinomadura sp. GC306]TDC70902.1 hypothetical protein E1200_03980 [Actinomadura sp. GC306]